VRVYADMVT